MNSTLPAGTELILASSSPFRRELLQRLGLPFACLSPDIDESLQPGESVADATARLSRIKAQTIGAQYPGSWVLASDQLCAFEDAALGKPGTRERAAEQLALLSGRRALFHTAVCLQCDDRRWEARDVTEVQFRSLDSPSIERYLDREDVLGCAGSFRSEGLGIALFQSISSKDPTALIGLPLIATAGLLREAGFEVP